MLFPRPVKEGKYFKTMKSFDIEVYESDYSKILVKGSVKSRKKFCGLILNKGGHKYINSFLQYLWNRGLEITCIKVK